jgi:hypothetical protein
MRLYSELLKSLFPLVIKHAHPPHLCIRDRRIFELCADSPVAGGLAEFISGTRVLYEPRATVTLTVKVRQPKLTCPQAGIMLIMSPR